MHGVFDCISRNEDVASVLRRGYVGYDEAVAIVMEHEAAGEFVAARTRLRLVLRRRCGLGWRDIALTFSF